VQDKVQQLHDAVSFGEFTDWGRAVCLDLQIALKKEQ